MNGKREIRVIGGGLAGAEASWQLLKKGYSVRMSEMRPLENTPAHTTDRLAELVCSNSLKSENEDTASGLLKAELKMMDSLILSAAERARVPAGAALAVDRDRFSSIITETLSSFDGFVRVAEKVEDIDTRIPTLICTGPLTSPELLSWFAHRYGDVNLNFFDASAPIISAESVDMSRAFYAARFQKGDPDYLNLPMNKEEYLHFYHELINAECVRLRDFEKDVFEGCMPVEVMAKRGEDTLRFGPLRPVGLRDDMGNKFYAVAQLRKENIAGDTFNLVGFQTNLTFPEQKRVFSLIPALHSAEFLRYGVMHKNTYINSPEVLGADFRLKDTDHVYVGGQFSGVEGYVESAMSGLLCAVNLMRNLQGLDFVAPPSTTICGALSRYVATETKDFQPMNANFGILPELENKDRDKKKRKLQYYERGVKDMTEYVETVYKNL